MNANSGFGSGPTPPDASAPSPGVDWEDRPWARLGRLVLKEFRETLRDRRTILTLVLMPILLYPLLSVGFKQFLLGRAASMGPTVIRVGCPNEFESRFLRDLLESVPPPQRFPGAPPASPLSLAAKASNGNGDGEAKGAAEFAATLPAGPRVVFLFGDQMPAALRDYQIDVLARLENVPPNGAGAPDPASAAPPAPDAPPSPATWRFEYLEGSSLGAAAAEYLERWLIAARERALLMTFGARLPFEIAIGPAASVDDAEAGSGVGGGSAGVSLAALIPLILILMTITGAVYPSIDLTAGERERGTLEVLIASPASRFQLLMAKYAAVVAVAMLTAAANLAAMAATLGLTGLGAALFGEGLSWWGLVRVLALLLLFAGFFSAVLLVLTSFARGFKEAQAYLIPLMLVSLAPGFAALAPGIKLTWPLAFVPLLNIVLLSRDLLSGQGETWATAVVAGVTMVYGASALWLAARLFGNEAILNTNQGAWSELLARRGPGGVSIGTWLVVSAATLVANLLVGGAIAQSAVLSTGAKLGLAAIAQLALFLAIPAFVARGGGLAAAGLRLVPEPTPGASGRFALATLAALALATASWTLAHEIVVFAREIGIGSVGQDLLERTREATARLRDEVSPIWLMLAIAVLPAVSEEIFFRGFLFEAFRRRFRARRAVIATALIFGAFHLVTPTGLLIERFVVSTLLGLLLGSVRAVSGSILPGILLHVGHNGLLTALFLAEPWLRARGWGVEERVHLPVSWIAAGAVGVAVGVALLILAARRGARPSIGD